MKEKQMTDSKRKFEIETVDLNEFTFKPPGPMGWNEHELEEIVNNVEKYVVNDGQNIEDILASLKNRLLIELPTTSVSTTQSAKKH
jgi:hypothetical protein